MHYVTSKNIINFKLNLYSNCFFNLNKTFSSNKVRSITTNSLWLGLERFATILQEEKGWATLKASFLKVQRIIDQHLLPRLEGRPQPQIRWKYWKKKIKHEALLNNLQETYNFHSTILHELLNHQKETKVFHNNDILWLPFEKAVNKCREAVATSQSIVEDGQRALWLSYHNPAHDTLPVDDWLESDTYWQAYIEQHFFYDPSKDTDSLNSFETFEDQAKFENYKKQWKESMDNFHDRSDKPVLYSYMTQLYSTDYYSLNKKTFLDHIIYFLIRTGKTYHFFPEVPPLNWISDIEQIRHDYLTCANKRKFKKQIESMNYKIPLDLCPTNEKNSEQHFYKLAIIEKDIWEIFTAVLMENYCFLTYPAIPCQTVNECYRATQLDNSKGKWYTIGSDVQAVFYIPKQSKNSKNTFLSTLSNPHGFYDIWSHHLSLFKLNVNEGYLDCVKYWSQILEKRGYHWFCGPNESMADAFLRRLNYEDPTANIYKMYITELQERWKTKSQEIDLQKALTMCTAIQPIIDDMYINATRILKNNIANIF